MKKCKRDNIRFPLLERLERIANRSKPGDKWSNAEMRTLRKLKRLGQRIMDLTTAV